MGGKTVTELQQERSNLRRRLEDIESEILRGRRPEWLTGNRWRSEFDLWVLHAGIEIMTPEADAAYEGWCAARENWARTLHRDTLTDLLNSEYTHWGNTGHLEIWYTLNGKDTIKEKVMAFSDWKLRPKDFHNPPENNLRKWFFCQGTLTDTEGTRRFLGFLERYWKAHHEDRPVFDDMLVLSIKHGDTTYYKGMKCDTVPAAHSEIFQRFEEGQHTANFSFWFRDWYDPS